MDLKARRNVERITLVNPPMRLEQVYGSFSEWGSISPPTGLCYIAALLRERGYEVSIVDAEALRIGADEAVRSVEGLRPDLIGIACKTLWVVNAHHVAQKLKEKLLDVPIVAGGNHVTALPERSLREFPAFDIVVVGEGEITFLELVEAMKAGKDLHEVPGLAFRDNGGVAITPPRDRIVNLDELPVPAFDLLPDIARCYKPPLNSVEKIPAFSLVMSRGCPSKCTFCDRSVFQTRVTRHSPEYAVALIEKLYEDYGVRYLLFDDDNLLLNKTHLFRLLDLLKASRARLPFTCQSRVDTIDEERLTRLQDAGCRMLLYGIESGSQEMLNRMKKGITIEQIRQAISMTRKAGIKATGFFILGHPGETEQTMQETVKLIKECKFFDVGVFLFTPLPGSEAYHDIREHGTFDENWEKMNALDEVVFVPHGLTTEKLKSYSDLCFKACYSRLGQVLSIPGRLTSMAHVKAVLKSVPKMLLGK
jgi:radical SAM superfamily enzyme YgiQ (UPF0313 family)